MYVSIQGSVLTQTGKIGGRKLGTKTPRQPEGAREREKDWHELFLMEILESGVRKAGARKMKNHYFPVRTLLRCLSRKT